MSYTAEKVAPAGTFVAEAPPALTRAQKRLRVVAAIVLVAAGMFTVKGFLPALAWAAIFAIALWPFYGRMVARFPRHRREALPLLFVTGVLLLFVIPLAMIVTPLVHDAHAVSEWLAQARTQGVPPPAFLTELPYGARLAAWWQREVGQPGALSTLASHTMQGNALHTARTLGAKAVHRLVLLGFMLLALFFLLRDGDAFVAELRVASRRAFGQSGEDVGQQMVRSVHGTVNGLVLVGLGEGVVLGIAYAVAGVPHPTLFGLLTAVLAMIPFGAAAAFIVAALVLAAAGKLVAAAIIVALGFVVTFVADHFVRPVLIGGATRLPFLWVLLGILGGVEGWGLVGLFLGPAVMAALVLLWREWTGVQRGPLNPLRTEVRDEA